VILGFTGPIESITPAMADGAELAMAEVNDAAASWTA
jgi:branched-chain amino acid transport system substrate-binding protein